MIEEKRIESAYALLKAILELYSSIPSTPHKVIKRVEVECPLFDMTKELSRLSRYGKYFWASRDRYFEMIGWGEADVVIGDPSETFSYQTVFQKLQEKLTSTSFGVRYYGGFKFNPLDGRGERWKLFKSYRFVVPLLEIVRRAKGTFLCANLILGGPQKTFERQFTSLVHYLNEWIFGSENHINNNPTQETKIDLRTRVDIPDLNDWQKLVSHALNEISSGRFKKVVMARETTFTSKNNLDPIAILSKLLDYASNSYAFCFNPEPGRAFIGISPECLFKVISTYLETEALAGTTSRNGIDKEIKTSLLNNSKELHEHSLVVDALKENLSPLTNYLQYDESPLIFELPNLYHLHTRFRGVLKANVNFAHLLEILHPTPAIGGYPKDPAINWLKTNEPIDRGIYSGPVGWVSYDSAEFCVGIRSALIQRNELSLYAGAGIVQGSTPYGEWNELEQKIKSFINIIS